MVGVVGAPLHDHGGFINCGAAYVYRTSGTGWDFEGELLAETLGSIDPFGFAVDVHPARCRPRLYVFPLFLTAAVVLATGFIAQANGYSGPLRLEAGPVSTLTFIVSAYMVARGAVSGAASGTPTAADRSTRGPAVHSLTGHEAVGTDSAVTTYLHATLFAMDIRIIYCET
jgi:hypothetical protein